MTETRIDFFSPKKHTNDQQVCEKVANILNYPRKYIKTIMNYLFTPVKMATIRKTRDDNYQPGYRDKKNLVN